MVRITSFMCSISSIFVWTIITFLVLFFVLAKFAWKPLIKMLQDREEMIRDSLNDAEKAKAELETNIDGSVAIKKIILE